MNNITKSVILFVVGGRNPLKGERVKVEKEMRKER